jgi:small conductance mechanosensitive channel
VENILNQVVDFGTTYGIRVVGAIVVLIVGRIAAGTLRGAIRRMMSKRQIDPSLIGFVTSLVYVLVIVFTVVATLSNFGVQVASFVAVLGAASFAVGFALQGSLSNFASGVMLLLFRPFGVGDYVTAGGVSGSVKQIDLFTTTLATPDNAKTIVPNSRVFGDTIHNYAGFETRRMDLPVGISYGASIEKAKSTLEDVIAAESRLLPDPAPMVAVTELADSSVNLVVRVWVKRGDYWDVKFGMTRAIKEALDANDIEIPFPQRVVHMVNAS